MVPPNGAGFVIFCCVRGETRFLLLKGKWGDRTWGFPKGHIDKRDNNDFLVTARRETEEETGIREVGLRPGPGGDTELGRVTHTMNKTRNVPSGVKHVVFFLGELQPSETGGWPECTLSKEHTRAQWFTLRDTRKLMRDEYHPMLDRVPLALPEEALFYLS